MIDNIISIFDVLPWTKIFLWGIWTLFIWCFSGMVWYQVGYQDGKEIIRKRIKSEKEEDIIISNLEM